MKDTRDQPWNDTTRINAMIERMSAFMRTFDEIQALPVTFDCPKEGELC